MGNLIANQGRRFLFAADVSKNWHSRHGGELIFSRKTKFGPKGGFPRVFACFAEQNRQKPGRCGA